MSMKMLIRTYRERRALLSWTYVTRENFRSGVFNYYRSVDTHVEIKTRTLKRGPQPLHIRKVLVIRIEEYLSKYLS